jgi:hypothetical protein
MSVALLLISPILIVMLAVLALAEGIFHGIFGKFNRNYGYTIFTMDRVNKEEGIDGEGKEDDTCQHQFIH